MPKERTYFETRIVDELGITPKLNKITLYNEWDEKRVRFDAEIFTEDDKGNIRILPFTLDRMVIQYDHPNAKPEEKNINNDRFQTFYITRLKEPEEYTDKEGNVQFKKYHIPKGAGTHPFITPGIIEKFEKKTEIDTLVLTEGYFKAFKGFIHGLDIIGLSSITHMKQKDTGKMYFDVIRVIKECKVKNIVMLYDGDCLTISTKALENNKELSLKPSGFLGSCSTIYELLKDYLKDYSINLYFAHINSEQAPNNAKGLDDILVELKGRENEIVDELTHFSAPGNFIIKKNISTGTGKLIKYFGLQSAATFYEMHSTLIKDKEFIFKGTQYKYNQQTQDIDMIIPKAAKDYFRVGDSYYEFVLVPNHNKQLERSFHRRLKSTIIDDHGAKFVNHIPKYKAFCNVPDHVNFLQVMDNCFNVYSMFEHESSEEGSCNVTLNFFKHIFGEMYELGLDYVQLLYQKPTQVLPILCLVSKENKTGKSTFIQFMKEIFTGNCTIVGNDDLSSAFNAHWATKLLVCCEESFIDKMPIIERIKQLSTGKSIQMNSKGKDQTEIPFFGKFILGSNNEDSFIYARETDIRYWVIKVPVPQKENVYLPGELIEEIPAFLHFLDKRKMSTKYESRMWFAADLLITPALKKLIENCKPKIEKDIHSAMKNLFFEFHDTVFILPTKVINKELLNNKYPDNDVSKTLRDKFKCDYYRDEKGHQIVKQYAFPKWRFIEGEDRFEKYYIKDASRPFVLKIENFLSPSEIEEFNYQTDNNDKPTAQPAAIPPVPSDDLPF